MYRAGTAVPSDGTPDGCAAWQHGDLDWFVWDDATERYMASLFGRPGSGNDSAPGR